MSIRLPRPSTVALSVASGALIVTVAAVATPAHAAPTAAGAAVNCAADPWEVDDSGTGAVTPIAVGQTVHRAICQTGDVLPGKTQAQDLDWFSFTATEGQAYTASVTDVGAGLVNDGADRGGLFVGFEQVGPDGQPSGIVQSSAPDGDRSTTMTLHAGRYLLVATDHDQQGYPDNTLGLKTVTGSDGTYGITLTATAPEPVLKSLVVSPNPVKAGDKATATLTFTAPLLSGGAFTPVMSSDGFTAAPGGTQVAPGGVTKWTVPIDARRVNRDTTVTISAKVAGVGPTLSVPLTVKK